jgi:hypothetical protein
MLREQETLGLGTSETKELLVALRAFRKGDFAARLPADWQGTAGKVADAFNDLADMGDRMTKEVDRVGQVIGKEGKVVGPVQVEGVSGTWKDLTDTINQMIATLCETIQNGIEQARLVEEHRLKVEIKSREAEEARSALQSKAEQLALTSKYKSEFLANMSHELRTPLNSLLILSQLLAENPEGNLSDKQKEFARTIHSSGNDLLALINDILDLSKVESGTVTVDVVDVPFAGVRDQVEQMFRHVAQPKNLAFAIHIDQRLPRAIRTDHKRLLQVIKNLLANAFKFTSKGGIDLRVEPASSGWSFDHEILSRAPKVIAFTVTDTGIGIPAEKQKVIFEAFQQADGSTSRRYGGTGLGLAISHEVAILLGGELRLVSSLIDRGSAFTLFLPINYEPPPTSVRADNPATESRLAGGSPPAVAAMPMARDPATAAQTPAAAPAPRGLADDRNHLQPGDRVVLIVEDDLPFADVLLSTARQKGFKGIVTARGQTALALARQFKVAAITLDIRLPDINGWTVLDRLKRDPQTRHIPVHVISIEDDGLYGRQHGAIACITKPVSKEALDGAFAAIRRFLDRGVKQLLVVEEKEEDRKAIAELIGSGDVHITSVASGQEALKALASSRFDCIVLDLMLPDMTGFEVLDKARQNPLPLAAPIIVYTAKELSPEEEAHLKKLAETLVVKGVHSPERLLDETSLFLHCVASRIPAGPRAAPGRLGRSDAALKDKVVLIVDDDARNLLAIIALLQRHEVKVLTAENGKDALEVLARGAGVDIILMDIMMPQMDGYETIAAVRQMPRFKGVPIIALTAKAMKGDREKCIEAGASDYIAKPVDPDQLLSLLDGCLHR